jgi:Cutinase
VIEELTKTKRTIIDRIMMPSTRLVAIVTVLANLASARPSQLLGTEHMSLAEITKLTWTVDRHMLTSSGCLGQSCVVADTAGSTGRVPILKAEGAGDSDIKCIIKHNPVVGDLLKNYNDHPPEVPKQNTTFLSSAMLGLNDLLKPLSNPRETGKFGSACATNILIFAKGTFEPGIMGITIGPQLASGLPTNWSSSGVDYDADIAGAYCLGLPGGMVAKDVINGAYEKCPNSNLFLSGVSQGAMVIRNGLARASEAAKTKVKVSYSCSFH